MSEEQKVSGELSPLSLGETTDKLRSLFMAVQRNKRSGSLDSKPISGIVNLAPTILYHLHQMAELEREADLEAAQSSEEQRSTPSEASSSSQTRDELQFLLTQAQARATAAEGEMPSREDVQRVLIAHIEPSSVILLSAIGRAADAILALRKPSSAQQTITQLTRELETARKVMRGSYSVMARAFGPLHSSPRTSNTEIAQQLGKSRAEIEAFLSSLSHQDEQG